MYSSEVDRFRYYYTVFKLNFSIISKELEVFAKSPSPANKLLNSPINLENHDYEILKNYFKI